jgi:hypothetical protein
MTSAKELSQFVGDMLASPPRGRGLCEPVSLSFGEGVASLRSEGEILDTLCGLTANFGGRTVTEKEIQPAPKNFRPVAWTSDGCNPTSGSPTIHVLTPILCLVDEQAQ